MKGSDERQSRKEGETLEQGPVVGESKAVANDLVGDDDYFADVGFMFEASQPVRLERFHWEVKERVQEVNDGETDDTSHSRRIAVSLHVADDAPGAVQSGHYLWPAAKLLCDYLVGQYQQDLTCRLAATTTTTTAAATTTFPIVSIVELGAGCALVSLTALQLWQDSLQYVCVTDHDPGTLIRAKDNLETTMQSLLGDCDDDDHLNAAINSLASIPVLFESLEWGDTDAVDSLLCGPIQDHVVSNSNSSNGNNTMTPLCVSLVLGSDLIYCVDVVQPLLKTAAQLMGKACERRGEFAGRFLLSQSFAYDAATEIMIDRVCAELGLIRTILFDDDDGSKRIQEFAL